MKTLLVILSYAKANETVARHWPYYELTGCNILGVGREDSDCRWPTGPENRSMIGHIEVGKDSYVNGDNLCRRIVDVLERLVDGQEFQAYTDFLLTEHDAIFLHGLPGHMGGMITTLGGYGGSGFTGTKFYHGPWWVDRQTAGEMVLYGRRMLKLGLIETGFPDRFIGLMDDLYDLGVSYSDEWTYSRNALDRPEYIQEARKAIERGAWYVHGIKTEAQLKAVTEGVVSV